VFLVEFEFGWAIRVPTLRGFGAGLGLVWLCVFLCPWIRCLWKNMEEVTEGVANLNVQDDTHKKNRIQVSNTKKPLFFYVNLAKRYMQQHEEVELSALGMAIATVVTVAEILKNNGLAVEKRIQTSTVDMRDETRGRPIQKAKVEIILGKSEHFDELMAAAAEERELAPEVDDQS